MLLIFAFFWLLQTPLPAQVRGIVHREPARTADRDLDFAIDLSRWRTFTLEGEVRFGHPGGAFRLSFGAELEAVPAEGGGEIRLRMSEAGKVLFKETELLKPQPNPRWGAGAQEELEALARALPGWQDRWFPFRVEVAPEEAWFAFDGRAMAAAPLAGRSPHSARVRLPAGSALRNLAVREGGWPSGGFRPVPLAGYTHSVAARAEVAGAGELIHAGGIPFSWAGGAGIDVGEAGLRLRRKPSGPNSLYQNPFNAISAMDGDPLTILLRVPKRSYRRLYLLAAALDRDRSPKLTVRLARYRGEAGCIFADSEVTVPYADERPAPAMPTAVPVRFPQGPGSLWLIEVPLDAGAMQSVLHADWLRRLGNRSAVLRHDAGVPWLDLELTRELKPDLQAMLPLGPRSGVHIYAATLEESPVEMLVTSPAAGNVFTSPEIPQFQVALRKTNSHTSGVRLAIQTRDPYGVEKSELRTLPLDTAEPSTWRIALPQKQHGYHEVTFVLRDAQDRPLVTRRTTFAVLPPDTRQAERDSPFGMWSWGGGHLSPPNEVEAELMRKAGVRFTLGVNYPSKHASGIGTSTDIVTGIFYSSTPVPGDPAGSAIEMIRQMKTRGSNPKYWQIYWEDIVSDRHHRRFPPAAMGEPPPVLNEAEQARFQAYWDRARAYAEAVRMELPQEKLALGAFLNFTEEFLRRGFPRPLLDALSLEVGGFRAHPERPPDTDNVYGLYFLEELKKKYGYTAFETILVESFYHGTAPGYLTERDQANYYVRDHLLSLAYGVKLFGMSAMIADVSGDYYRSPWGSAGICHRAPEANPKPAYVAYATMTHLLDRARYVGQLDTGSATAHALRFRDKRGANLYALWTVRGERDAHLALAAGASVVDPMHNERPVMGGRVRIGEAPVYVRTAGEVMSVRLGPPSYPERPPADAVLVDSFRDLTSWIPREERSGLLETVNPRYPRRQGAATITAHSDPARGPVALVTARSAPGHPLVPRYAIFERRGGIPLPGRPLRLGLWVRGNSSWSRISVELTDARGERWTAAGGGEDIYGRSFVNFDGWRWMEFDLCGHFRPDYPRPTHNNWTAENGDGLVDFPLTVTKLILELRDHVVHGNRLRPVEDQSFALGGLYALE